MPIAALRAEAGVDGEAGGGEEGDGEDSEAASSSLARTVTFIDTPGHEVVGHCRDDVAREDVACSNQ